MGGVLGRRARRGRRRASVNSERLPARRPRIARVVLAVALLAMATGQLADLSGFVEALRGYDIGAAPLAGVVAVGLVVGEVAGGGLLVGSRTSPRASGAVVALAVAIAWSTLPLSAFVRGEPLQNCACFGVYLAQPLRWWTLLEDAEFVALSAWFLLGGRGSASEGRARLGAGFRTRTKKGAAH